MVVHIVLGLMWKMMCLKFFHSKVSQNLTSFLSSRLHEDAISFFTFLLLSEIPLPFKQPPFLTYWQTNTAHSGTLFSANVSHSRLKHSISSPLWCHFCTFPPDNPALQPSSFLFPSFILFWATSSPVKAHDESSYNYPLYSQEHLNRSLFFFFEELTHCLSKGVEWDSAYSVSHRESWKLTISNKLISPISPNLTRQLKCLMIEGLISKFGPERPQATVRNSLSIRDGQSSIRIS